MPYNIILGVKSIISMRTKLCKGSYTQGSGNLGGHLGILPTTVGQVFLCCIYVCVCVFWNCLRHNLQREILEMVLQNQKINTHVIHLDIAKLPSVEVVQVCIPASKVVISPQPHQQILCCQTCEFLPI